MARIRTIKPEFFRHEGLQDLAEKHGAHVMLVFAGLWGHCDKAGRFEWKPRLLKLDILPFLGFDMAETLDALWHGGFIHRYEVEGKEYGKIASFEKHQRIGGKEAQEPAKHPPPTGYKQGSNGEATGKQQGLQEGKGREKEGNGCLPPTEVGKTGKPVLPPCPIDEIISIYHEACPTLPKFQVRNETRDGYIRARWRQFFSEGDFTTKEGGIDCFRWFFDERVKPSKFLTGQMPGRNNGPPFVADLEWLMRPTNFAKVIEGKYQ